MVLDAHDALGLRQCVATHRPLSERLIAVFVGRWARCDAYRRVCDLVIYSRCM